MSTTIIGEILGQVFSSVVATHDEMIMTCTDGRVFKFWHSQDCCESVQIEDVAGDLDDLTNTPIVRAEERVSENEPDRQGADDSNTWTFYEIATVKGSVTVRWLGSSNGYYSESVSYGWPQ